ncbi:hypothetical protein ACF06N_23610 [Streptomyces albidoflavus]
MAETQPVDAGLRVGRLATMGRQALAAGYVAAGVGAGGWAWRTRGA